MPNFNPDTLEFFKKLYSIHLGYIPSLIENADKEMQSLNGDSFITCKPRVTSISETFIDNLQMLCSQVISDSTMSKEYCTPINLLLKEFGAWINTRNPENLLQEISEVENRFALYRELFLNNNLLEISPDKLGIFNSWILLCQLRIDRAKKELNIFDLHESIIKEDKTLWQLLNDFNKSYPVSIGDEYSILLSNKFDKSITKLCNEFENLSKVFMSIKKKGAFIESDLQDMRACLERIALEIEGNIDWMEVISLCPGHNAHSQSEVVKDITAQIKSSTQRILMVIDMIKRKIGPDINRFNGGIRRYTHFPAASTSDIEEGLSNFTLSCD